MDISINVISQFRKDTMIEHHAEASSDPFYVYKDEMESIFATLHEKFTKWKLIIDLKDSPTSSELPELTSQMKEILCTAESSLDFIEQTIVMVVANRSKFEHIDQGEIENRRKLVASKRVTLHTLSQCVHADDVRKRVEKEEKKLLMPQSSPLLLKNRVEHTASPLYQQQELMQQQDDNLAGLSKSVNHLNSIAVEIGNEISTQNKMLDDLGHDIDSAQTRMNYVLDRMGRLLQTKDKCQLSLILFLMIVLIIMLLLVIYT